MTLYTLPKRKDAEEAPDQFDDVLDRHVDDVLKRPSKLKRSMMGVGSFLRTRKPLSVALRPLIVAV